MIDEAKENIYNYEPYEPPKKKEEPVLWTDLPMMTMSSIDIRNMQLREMGLM
jgi:hypothetical protein